LQCGTFGNNLKDKFAFKNFLTQFNNLIQSKQNLSDASKLTYLRGYVRGYALKVIEHLSITDENFEVALTLLKKEFLDIALIIDDTIVKILNSKPGYDQTYHESKVYLSQMRALLFELKGIGYDYTIEDSPGCIMVSHILFSKLPMPLKRELTHKLNSNYPSLNSIFECYNDCIKTLNNTTSVYKSNYT